MSGPSGFRNPIIPGFHPDPSVCRYGDQYVLVTSSFTYFPGVPVFRSPDLINWTQVGSALDRESQLDLSGTAAWSSGGVFAPTVRYHDGQLWMVTTVFNGTGMETFFVTAADPAGPWSDPIPVAVVGIDPDIRGTTTGPATSIPQPEASTGTRSMTRRARCGAGPS
jgi:beta-xylosidase